MGEFPKVIRDPVHNLIELPEDVEGRMILALIDTPEFQRLRRIRQLGLGFLAYPGAEHSRWVHSLGVFHVARRMLDALLAHYGEDSEPYKELKPIRKEILAAALLHDVGHGPFSHAFERFIPEAVKPPEGYPKNHEGWSTRIISERFSEILKKHGTKPKVVVGLIDKKNRDHLLGKDFISSQLDADRMDYLLRDSHATGTRYGRFDLDWLLHSIRIGKVRARGRTNGLSRLCFNRKAIHVIEEYIQARESMYQQVYAHKTTRAYDAMLGNILALGSAITDGDPSKVPPGCPAALAKMLARRPVTAEEYLSLDDYRVWCCLIDWSNGTCDDDSRVQRLARICRRLVNREQPYKVIELDERGKQDEALKLVEQLRGSDQGFACYRDAFTDLAYRGVLYRRTKESEEEEDRAIFVLDETGDAHAIETESDLLRAIANMEASKYRLYYDQTDEEMMKRLRNEKWL